jgi:hypothetical protein
MRLLPGGRCGVLTFRFEAGIMGRELQTHHLSPCDKAFAVPLIASAALS